MQYCMYSYLPVLLSSRTLTVQYSTVFYVRTQRAVGSAEIGRDPRVSAACEPRDQVAGHEDARE